MTLLEKRTMSIGQVTK